MTTTTHRRSPSPFDMLILDVADRRPLEGKIIQRDPDSHQTTPDLSTRPYYIDNMPPEIVSEILRAVTDSYGNNIRQKWRSPLLLRRVSKRFYHIVTFTSSLWRYLHIHGPIHPYLYNHISHSEPGNLVVEVTYGGEHDGVGDANGSGRRESNSDSNDSGSDEGDDDEADMDSQQGEAKKLTTWREIVDLMVPRLRHLVLHSPADIRPIIELLSHKMPILEVLDVEGVSHEWLKDVLLSTYLPSLRSLRLLGFFYFGNCSRLPETLEELHIGSEWKGHRPQEHLWTILPPKLRILRMEPNVVLEGLKPPHLGRIYLPCVTELHLSEYYTDTRLCALQRLDAPGLQTLEVDLDCPKSLELDFRTWYLDFPMLTHLKWRSYTRVPHFGNFLRRCGNLTSVHIEATTPWYSISDFVMALTMDTTLLPLLEDLLVFGVSLFCLRSLVESRPRLKRLEVHRTNLRPNGLELIDETSEWYNCRAWLASRIELCASDLRGFGPL